MSDWKGKKCAFIGGGTLGHVMPNISLARAIADQGADVVFLWQKAPSIEAETVTGAGFRFLPIAAGKWRRYRDWRNVRDVFLVLKGCVDAFVHLRRERPDVLFSKGGFVSLPGVYAARALGIPVVVHESDTTFGLTTRLCAPCAQTICTAFPSQKPKTVWTGIPLRSGLHRDKNGAQKRLWLHSNKPVLLVVGGSQGAQSLNECVLRARDMLLQEYQMVHIWGKNNTFAPCADPDYHPYAFVSDQMSDMLAAADVVISRSGATACFEFLWQQVPVVFFPLGGHASRGDQWLNAQWMCQQSESYVLAQQDTPQELCQSLQWLRHKEYKSRTSPEWLEGAQSRVLYEIQKVII